MRAFRSAMERPRKMKSARVMDHPRKIENDHVDENEAGRSDRGKSDRFHGGFSSGTVACVGRAHGDGLGARPIQSADRTDRLLRWITGGGGELLGTTGPGEGDTPSVHRARMPFLSAGRGRYAASGVTLPHLDYPDAVWPLYVAWAHGQNRPIF